MKFLLIVCVLPMIFAHKMEKRGVIGMSQKQLKWQLLRKNACLHGRNDMPAIVPVWKSGFLVAAKLVHRSGAIRCTASSFGSNFGCSDHTKLNILVCDNKRNIIFPAYHQIKRTSQNFYELPGFTSTDREIIFSDFVYPVYVKAGDYLTVWNGEDLSNHYEHDNSGSVCVDVYVSFFDIEE